MKVSSADALEVACLSSLELLTGEGSDPHLHAHVLPSIPLGDADKIHSWALDEKGCEEVHLHVANRGQFRCKLDAFCSIDCLRRSFAQIKENVEDSAACLRILAHGKAKEVEELAKRKDAAIAAYLAARDGTPPLAGDDLKAWRKEALAAAGCLLVAKKARKALDEAAVVMRSLADSIALEIVKLEGTLQDLTLMGCGHPDAVYAIWDPSDFTALLYLLICLNAFSSFQTIHQWQCRRRGRGCMRAVTVVLRCRFPRLKLVVWRTQPARPEMTPVMMSNYRRGLSKLLTITSLDYLCL